MTHHKNKTICFFNTNRAWGGGEKWHFTAALKLRSRGYETLMVTNMQSKLRARSLEENLNVYSFYINNLSFLNPLKLLVLYFFFKSKKIDTVILNLPSDLKCAGIAAKLAGVNNIIYRRGMPHPLRDTWLNKWLFQKVLTRVIVNSEEIGRSLTQSNTWFPKEKLQLVYNGIDLQAPTDPTAKVYERKNGEVILGNAGRLTHQKGQKYLIEMAEILNQQKINFKLLIAGEGELRQELQAQINAKGLSERVILLGHVQHIQNFMNSIDIFVFPSLFEGSANTLIETLFFKKPIVAFDVSSNPEIIQHKKNGLLAKAFDSQDLAKCVSELLNSPQLAESYVQNGLLILNEKFDNQKIFSQLETII